ncbi:MAG: glycosyltransferase family 4 protein [Candidatus Latescibacter sp.]|nr:glycosyltransferase family 4 protein [Candidatus Latescibacter sp.]
MTRKKVLVLLMFEVLEDSRVWKTCLSLRDRGAEVTVACTNPSSHLGKETCEGISIVRFPHPQEFFLKRLYHLAHRWLPVKPAAFSPAAAAPDGQQSSPVKELILQWNHRHYMRNMKKLNRTFIRAFSGGKFDLIHANDVDTLYAGSELRRRGCANALLYDSHEYWAGMSRPGSYSNISLQRFEGACIRDADFVVTVNPFIAGRLKENYELQYTPSVVMNCPPLWHGELSRRTIEAPVRVIFQGKLQAYRGLEELILAFRHIPGAALTLSGYGPIEGRLKLLAEREGLKDRVRFTGRYPQEETMPMLSSQDIGAIPYQDVVMNNVYSSPNKLFNYAMAGMAIVTSSMPFLASTVKEHNMGEVFTGSSPEDIARAIQSLVSDPVRLRACKENARRAAEEWFSWEKQFERNYPWKQV